MIFLSNEVLVFLILESLVLFLQAVAFFSALPILKKWDIDATTTGQYTLEKRAYLVALLVFFTAGFKILLLPFFCQMIDSLAGIIPGAMCGAGVINANVYGMPLLGLKVLILGLYGIWLMVNKHDLEATNYPHVITKFRLFVVAFVFTIVETVLDVLFLTNISTLTPVQCCSNIFGAGSRAITLPLGLDTASLLVVFFLVFALTIVLSLMRKGWLNLLANIGFLYFGYLAVVYFFGTYVYALPTHICPFCMLQREYFFVGYLIWGLLFLGVFFGSTSGPLRYVLGRDLPSTYRWNLVCNTLFVVLCCLYVGLYYLRNGVLL